MLGWMLRGQGSGLSSNGLTANGLSSNGLSSNAITAALRGESNVLGGLSDMELLLQMSRASQGAGFQNQQQNHQLASLLLGGGDIGTASNNNLNAVLLHQLANGQNGVSVTDANDQLSSLANAHHLLSFGSGNGGGNNLANAFFRPAGAGMDSNGVSDALSLLARSIQRNDANRGFGRPDGTGRFN